jgi:hypothetical protein
LQQLFEILPVSVRSEFSKALSDEDMEISNVEGKKYLDLFMKLIMRELRTLETQVHLPSKMAPSRSQERVQGITMDNMSVLSEEEDEEEEEDSEEEEDPSPPVATAQKSVSTATVAKQTSKGAQPVPAASSKKASRWECPINGHESHSVTACAEFFTLSVKERQKAMWQKSCFTCLSSSSGCRGARCSNRQSVPPDVLCTDCGFTTSRQKIPLCFLLCGSQSHAKPDVKVLSAALEKWIPELNLVQLGVAVNLNIHP